MDQEHGFKRLLSIVTTLRGENGCAWDKNQTPRSLLPNLIEEAYELMEAVEDEDDEHIKEELGDLFLLVTMISYIKQEKHAFDVNDVFDEISDKLVRRHPHVFGEIDIDDPDHIIRQWNDIKRDVEKRDESGYITDSVPYTIPPLERAYKLQKKVSHYGFDWKNVRQVIDKLQEEIVELEDEIEKKDRDVHTIENEIGDILFAAINIARFLKIDPSNALNGTNRKFIKRFSYIEDKLKENNVPLSKEQLDIMEKYWNESKQYFP